MHCKQVPQKLVLKLQASPIYVMQHSHLCKGIHRQYTGHSKDLLTVVLPSKDLTHLRSVYVLCLVILQFKSCHYVI